MSDLFEWLLGLERIRLSGDPLSIELTNPPAPWAMLAGVVLIALLVVLVYHLERGSRRLRAMLAAIRISILLLVLGLMARPNLVLSRDLVDRSVVAVMVDASGSMLLPDDPLSPTGAAESNARRFDQAVSALTMNDAAAMQELVKRHRVELWTFDEHASRIERAADAATVPQLPSRIDIPGDDRSSASVGTDLASALEDVLAQTQGSRLAGVVVLSDGRQTRATPIDRALHEANRRQAVIHTLALGSTEPRKDVAIEAVRTDEDVFRQDIVSIVTQLRIAGYPPDTAVNLELLNTATQTVLDRRTATVPANGAEQQNAAPATQDLADVEFRFRPDAIGRLALKVRATPLTDEHDLSNNEAETSIRVHDEKIRVLYVEGPPRFEYRFLKNTLIREPTVVSSCLLLDATAAFVQEGAEPVRAFPISPGDLSRYDVVLLGDVDPREDWLSPAQAAMLVDFVNAGGGLAFVAGERAMPHRLADTVLEKLLPVKLDSAAAAYRTAWTEPFQFRPTPEGMRHPLLRFEVKPEQNEETIAALEGWYWYARVAAPKPGAVVLADHPGDITPEGPMPLIVSGRYGAGRTLYLGSDDVWRWRRYHSEAYYDAFWLNMLRVLAGDRRLGGANWRFSTDRRTYEIGQRATFELTARNPSAAIGLSQVRVRIDDARGEPRGASTLKRVTPDSLRFEGTYVPDREGVLTATAVVPLSQAAETRPSRSLTVQAVAPERRVPEADHAFLADLAARSGGKSVGPEGLAELAASIPDRSVRITDDVVESLWDTRLALLLFMALLVTEWVGRKLKGLP